MSRWILCAGNINDYYRLVGEFETAEIAKEAADAAGGEWYPWKRIAAEDGYYRRSMDLTRAQKVVFE